MRTLGIAALVGLMVGCGASSSSAPRGPESAMAGYPGGASGGSGGSAGTASAGTMTASARSGGAAMPSTPAAESAPFTAGAPALAAGAFAGAAADGAGIASGPQTIAPSRPVITHPQAGQLTAGIWDDNRNFDFWKPYAVRFTESHGSDFVMFTQRELDEARTAAAQQAPRTELDIQLVLDTTGSMGDELSYLQSEFDSIATQVRTKFPNVTPRWSLVVYKDHGDEYVAKGFEFTTDTNKFRQSLRAQSAGGGGDIPEAVVEGLTTGLKQQWRTAPNVAKLAFWVADAPAHPGEGQKLGNVIRDAKSKGVHIYPVASSDADDAAEYQMRSAAQMTSGRYVFLTNDSGIGNSHAEPHIPCYNVSRLDHAIVRMIQVEMTGTFVEADSRQVIRQVGQPNQAGKCQLSSGMLVASY
jgi:hypothetical protein